MSIPPPLRKLQYVLAVARELHFRKAAERLNVSQPYVSRQIKEFEAEIGFDIFRRDSVALTASGHALVVRVSQMMNRLDDDFRNAVDDARAISQRYAREFTIGISPWTFPILRRQVRIVQRARFPKIRLRFRSLTMLELFDALDSGQIEAGMTFAPLGRDDLRQISLRSEYVCAVLPRANPLATPLRLLQRSQTAIGRRLARPQSWRVCSRGRMQRSSQPRLRCTDQPEPRPYHEISLPPVLPPQVRSVTSTTSLDRTWQLAAKENSWIWECCRTGESCA